MMHATPQIIFGGNVFGWTADAKTSFDLLDACVDHGLTTIDTADVYSRMEPGFKGGESEAVIGDWLVARGARTQVTLSTKFGLDMGDGRRGLGNAYMVQAVEASLRRLKTDHIDIYHAHWDDEGTPFEETLEGFSALQKAGKIGRLGLSNFTPDRFAAAVAAGGQNGLPAYNVGQFNYNLYDRVEFEQHYAPIARAVGMETWSYFSLASGFLTGKHRSVASLGGNKRVMWLADKFTPRGLRILDCLDALATQLNASPAQIAIAWLLHQPMLTAPIVSATSRKQLNDIVAATQLKLSVEALTLLNTASAYEIEGALV